MNIVRLPVGEPAPVDVDCIRIEEQADAGFRLTASALCIGTDEGESVSIVGVPIFATAAQAETAGIAWATNLGVKRLHVTIGTLEQPLKPLEIDRTL